MKVKEGYCEGRKLFGHYEGDSAIIEGMKELRTSGLRFDKILETLNTEGVKPRAGGRRHCVVVNRNLKPAHDSTKTGTWRGMSKKVAVGQ